MRTQANNTTRLMRVGPSASEEKTGSADAGLDSHEGLLLQIVAGFGLNKVDSDRILEEVRWQAKERYSNHKASIPLNVWLSKMLVRKCIFKISEDFFSGKNNGQEAAGKSAGCSIEYNLAGARRQQMPLSYWAVYLLHLHIGFTEKEIAEILNTSLMSVKERMAKALSFTGNNFGHHFLTRA